MTREPPHMTSTNFAEKYEIWNVSRPLYPTKYEDFTFECLLGGTRMPYEHRARAPYLIRSDSAAESGEQESEVDAGCRRHGDGGGEDAAASCDCHCPAKATTMKTESAEKR